MALLSSSNTTALVTYMNSDPVMPAKHNEIEKRLWEAADELRANSKLRSSEYSPPVLGLILKTLSDADATVDTLCELQCGC